MLTGRGIFWTKSIESNCRRRKMFQTKDESKDKNEGNNLCTGGMKYINPLSRDFGIQRMIHKCSHVEPPETGVVFTLV